MKLKRAIPIILIGSITLLSTGCSNETTNDKEVAEKDSIEETTSNKGFPLTFTDSANEEIILTQEPSRIVSLAPNTTEILYYLGVEDKIVGRTSYCNYPESIINVAEVGDAWEPNVETIVALEPDLIVTSTHTSPDIISKLREVGIAVAFLDEQESFEGTYRIIEQVGLLVGKTDQASEVISEMQIGIDNTLAKVKEISTDKPLPSVYYVVDYGEVDYTAGGDTFIGEMLNLAGAENIAKEIEGWSITKEVIAEKNPEIIIVPSNRGIVEAFSNEAFYKDLEAVKEGQIFEINDDMISRQGPRLEDALYDLVAIIHPELEQ